MEKTAINSSIMRSQLLDRDFQYLLRSTTLEEIVDDGFVTDEDRDNMLFGKKKVTLGTRYDDFKDCIEFLDKGNLRFQKRINRDWGTTERLHKLIEEKLGRPISHGALLLALDLLGMYLEKIDGRKDAYMNISSRSNFES